MAKHLKLQHSESIVLGSASQIYAAYILSGKVKEGEEETWMAKSIKEAIKLAIATDNAIISDDEVESTEF